VDADAATGITVREVARRYKVSPDKVRAWINRGELHAVNTARRLCGRPRWVVLPEALAAFEGRRAGGPAPKPARRRRPPAAVDFYPD
jgi:excisionase family DNA binding protein